MISPTCSVASILTALLLLLVPSGRGALHAQGSRAPRLAETVAAPGTAAAAARPALLFTENLGQWDGDARFQGTAGSATIRFEQSGVRYAFLVDSATKTTSASRYHLLSTRFLGYRPDVRVEGSEPTGAVSNYYLGAGESDWHLGARGFRGVRYRGLYDGIDALYYGRQGSLKYDFIVAPGADPDDIRLRYDGARKLGITPAGELEVTTAFGSVKEAPPYCYQQIGGRRVTVAGSYRLLGADTYGFTIGAHDARHPVVIDPCLSVEYATYLGGGGYDVVTSMAVDSSGFAYATGFTRAPDFPQVPEPTEEVPQENYVFLSKLSPDGTQLLYSTLIAKTYAGEYDEDQVKKVFTFESVGEDVEVTRTGEAIVALATNRDSLVTTTGVYMRERSKDDINSICGPPLFPNFDTYVARFNASGRIVWGTYLGGVYNDYLADIALDPSDNIYLTGTSFAPTCGTRGDSIDYPTTVPQGPFTTSEARRGFETFVSKLSSNGRTLQFSTLYGGGGNDVAGRIALDAAGKVYVLGSTNSANLPTTGNAYQGTRPTAGGDVYDIYLARIDATAGTLEYGTYFCDNGSGRRGLGYGGYAVRPGYPTLGGFSQQERHQGLVIDRLAGTVIFGGSTRSTTLPTAPGAFQQFPRNSGASGSAGYDGFVVNLNVGTNQIVGATYLSGSDYDAIGGIALDRFGDIVVALSTKSSDFPLSAVKIQPELRGTVDAAIVTLSPDARSLTYGSYYGGSSVQGSAVWEQRVYGTLADRDGAIYLFGGTASRDFPLSARPIQSSADYYQGYIVKFSAPTAARIGTGQNIAFEPNSCGTPELSSTTIFNSGQTPMRIESLRFKYGTYFSLVNAPALPLTLQPCDTLSLTIQFDPKDLDCKKTASDSLVITAPNAANPQAQLLVSGRRICTSIYFETTSIDIEKYRLNSEQYVGFGININGSTQQTITVEPDPSNTSNVFRPSQQIFRPGEGTSSLAFTVNATDTGRYCESFIATIQPCNITRKLTICAYVTTGIFSGVDSIGLGLISCKDVDIPYVVHNLGNDVLTVNIDYVEGRTPNDVDFIENVSEKIKIQPKDSFTYTLPFRPKGAGIHEAVVLFHTDEGPFKGTIHRVKITAELDSVVFRLMTTSITGGFGEIIELPVEYQPILEGRIPLEELTLHANFDPKLLTIVGLNPQGTLTGGWELVNVTYADSGAVFKIRKGSAGSPLTGTGRLMTLRLKVLRGDTIASPFDLRLAGVSRGCLEAEIDSGRLFQLNAECAAQLRLLYTDRHLLKQSIPNPAGEMVTIPYMIPEAGHVTLVMYDAGGREVLRLLDEEHAEGNAEVRFNSRRLAPGMYFYRITVGDTLRETRTMVIER